MRTIWRWERDSYGATQGRAPAWLKGRVARSPEGLLCTIDHGRLLGYADVVALTAEHFEQLRRGSVMEERLPAHWTARRLRAGSRCWYVASLIVAAELRATRPVAAHTLSVALQRAIWDLIARYGRFPARVLGISATPAGQAKFLQTGFRRVPLDPGALDPRPRYERLVVRRGQLATRRRVRLGPTLPRIQSRRRLNT